MKQLLSNQLKHHPLIIGHRGASAVAPENTLAAFTQALEAGADGVEFDVRLARDNVPVVIHDRTLGRTALVESAVSSLSSSQLSRIDVGSWFNRRHPAAARPDFARECVPTLQQVFQLFSNTAALLYLEMKCDNEESVRLTTEVVKLIRQFSFAEQTVVESFHLPAIKEIKRIDSGIQTAALFEPSFKSPGRVLRSLRIIGMAQNAGADEIALHHTLASRRVTENAGINGLPVIIWTVDDPVWIKRGQSLGIKALITNKPGLLVKAFSSS